MNEDEIKTLRHSFTSKEDGSLVSKNQFGHTVLGNIKNLDISNIEVKLNEFGEISAEPTHSLLDSPELQNLTSFVHKNNVKNTEGEVHKQNYVSNSNVTIKDLISSLDKMDGTSEPANIHPLTGFKNENNLFFPDGEKLSQTDTLANEHMKSCLNKDCLYVLPKDAKFCLECGTAQMSKFCTECGFHFPGFEKFCPDCGTKR